MNTDKTTKRACYPSSLVTRTGLHLCLSVFICGLLSSLAHADLPHARLERIFPLGGSAGSEVLLEIAGKDLDDVKELHFDHPGFKAEFVKPNQFRVRIAADVPAATYEVRAVGRFGISGARLFAVDRGLTEVLEKEPNDTPEKAQPVPLNTAINGRCDSNGDDFYRFPLKKGQRVVIDCRALRLDSTLRASLVLSSAEGRELARSRPYHERTDPLLDFSAPADGDYVLGLHDMTFSGGLPYRLIVSTRPYIENVFPAAVVPGVKTALTVLGRNLPGGKPSVTWTVQGQPLEEMTVSYTAPKDAAAVARFTFLDHPSSPNLNARGLQVRLPGLEDAVNPATLTFAADAVTREHEPNDTAETAQALTLPTTVCGRLDRPGDADWYTFTAKAGEQVAVDLLCERLGFPGDPFVLILNDKGQELASIDDHGINLNALAQFNRDPVGVFNVPVTGKYRLFVQDRYRKGGARYQYVLHLGNPRPDFYPVVFHETNPDPTCPLVRAGGSAFCEICLNRRNFNGPITLEAEGLPVGVTCAPVHVSPQAQHASVVFSAAANAAPWSGAIKLKAWALIDGQRVERELRVCQRRWNIANINTSRVCRELCLAVRESAPYAITLPAEKVTVAAGGKKEFQATVRRLSADFKGKVQLTGLVPPPGFNMATAEVAADKTMATIKLTVAGNVPAGTYTVFVRGDAQVPYNRDAKASSKPNVRVADPSTPLTVEVTAPAKK
jgi:hypothetical protein